jgi:tetratricopeptide (TPR) repeat protein
MASSILEDIAGAEGFFLEANELAESRRKMLYASSMTLRGADAPLRISIAQNLFRAERFDQAESLLREIKEDVNAQGAKYVYVEKEVTRYKVATATLLARVYIKLGKLQAARTELDIAKELASSNDDRNSIEVLAVDFAILDALEGNSKRARSSLLNIQSRLAARGYVVEWVNCIEELARIDLSDGDWESASRGLSVVLDYRRSLGDRVHLADSLLLMIEALWRGGRKDDAAQYFDELRTLPSNLLVHKRALAAARLLSI